MMRRNFFTSMAALFAGGAAATALATRRVDAAKTGECGFEICRSDAEWRERLTPAEFEVMRKEGTERAYTSPLNDEKRAGMFHCRGCDLALYSSETKYDSGTGWPSFWDAETNAIGTRKDTKFFMVRTECHCSRCGSHLGHIFGDGPQPTGKRHCINGVSLSFRAV